MTLSASQRAAAEAHLRYARELGIFDFYRRPFDSAQAQAWEAQASAKAIAIAPEIPPSIAAQEPLIARPQISVVSNIAPNPYTGSDKPAALHALQQEIGMCMRCPLATLGRHTVVFADGDPNAELMFVGEGPGADEDEQGLPFVGRAGQLLNKMITAMGTSRQQVYIANIVKCRPPKNRAPEPEEANTCLPFLLRQIDIVQPKLVVALGATAATYLTGMKTSLGSLRGRIHEFRGDTKLLITYHPAFLLRDPRQKKEAWADLQIAMKHLNMQPPPASAAKEPNS